MKPIITKIATTAALATGMLFAQTPAPSAPAANAPAAHERAHNGMRQHRERMAKELNLTDAQKQQAKSIFQNARETAKPVREELKQTRLALREAAKTGKSGEIRELSAKQGNLMGKMTAIRTEAFSKFYQVLTPEQRAKADQMQQQHRARLQSRRQNRQHNNG